MKGFLWTFASVFCLFFVVTFEFEYSILPEFYKLVNPFFEVLIRFSGTVFFGLDSNFNFEISSFINFEAYNLIEVTVDNKHNENIPPLDADFTFYGGIYRDVALISLPKQHFSVSDFASEGFYVNYYNVSQEKAGVEVSIKIDNKALKKEKTTLEVALFDREGVQLKMVSKKIKLNSDTTKNVNVKLSEVLNPKLWSPDNPYLYTLKLKLYNSTNQTIDYKSTNIGFRWTYLDPEKGFFLNGKPLKLIALISIVPAPVGFVT